MTAIRPIGFRLFTSGLVSISTQQKSHFRHLSRTAAYQLRFGQKSIEG